MRQGWTRSTFCLKTNCGFKLNSKCGLSYLVTLILFWFRWRKSVNWLIVTLYWFLHARFQNTCQWIKLSKWYFSAQQVVILFKVKQKVDEMLRFQSLRSADIAYFTVWKILNMHSNLLLMKWCWIFISTCYDNRSFLMENNYSHKISLQILNRNWKHLLISFQNPLFSSR